VTGQTATVAKAVSASSAFPGFVPPVAITAADLGVHEGQFPTESFTDGGVYDNLGIRAFPTTIPTGGISS
jgi:predicted acylesterase/phospholipase RssA